MLLQTGEPVSETEEKRKIRRTPLVMGPIVFAIILGAAWMGAAAAYLYGYMAVRPLAALPPPLLLVGTST